MDNQMIKAYAREYFKFGWNLTPLFGYSKNPSSGQKYLPIFWENPKTAERSVDKKEGWTEKQGWWPLTQRKQTAEEVKTWIDDPELTGLGVITGKISNVTVIDEDNYKEGGKRFKIESPLITSSANGGFHHYFKFNPDIGTTGLQQGVFIEIKSAGGFIVLPPTEVYKKDGTTIGKYSWFKKNLKTIDELPVLDESALAGISVQKEVKETILGDLTDVGMGEQHNSLRSLTNSLLYKHNPQDWEEFVYPIIREKASHYDPPHPAYRVEKMLKDCSEFILRKKHEKKAPQSITQVAQKRIAEKEFEKGAPLTGYPDLDRILKGFIPGHVYCLSGLTNCIDEESLIDCRILEKPTNTKPIKIKNLFRYFNEGLHIKVNSIDEKTNKIVKNNVQQITYSGYQECLQVKTDDLARVNGLVTTPDHLFYIGNGEYKKLGDLVVGDTVYMRSVHAKKTEFKKKLRYKETTVKYHPDSNKKKYINNLLYYRIRYSHLVYEASLNNMTVTQYTNVLNNYDGRILKTIPLKSEIHHIDGNHTNNIRENLLLIERKNHAAHHMLLRSKRKDFARYGLIRKITSITAVGRRHTYDITCEEPYHSFVAGGFIVHNCGKSSMACNFAVRVAEQDKKVLYFALEPDNNIVDYLASAQTGKRFIDLNNDDLFGISPNVHIFTKNQISTLNDMINALRNLPHYDLIIIDHLGYFIQGDSKSGSFQEQANTLKKLVELAQRQRTAVMFIVHMRKRASYGKPDKDGEPKIPGIDELKGSSALSQDSTDVLFVTRGVETDGITQTDDGRIAVVKTKSGKNGAMEIRFINDSARIIGPEEMATRMF